MAELVFHNREMSLLKLEWYLRDRLVLIYSMLKWFLAIYHKAFRADWLDIAFQI